MSLHVSTLNGAVEWQVTFAEMIWREKIYALQYPWQTSSYKNICIMIYSSCKITIMKQKNVMVAGHHTTRNCGKGL